MLWPIVENLHLEAEGWFEAAARYGGLFHRVAGSARACEIRLLLAFRRLVPCLFPPLPERGYRGRISFVESVPAIAPPRQPVPPELIARAEDLVRRYGAECFWFWHPEARVRHLDDVRLVVEHLREYGGHQAWREAQELQRCL